MHVLIYCKSGQRQLRHKLKKKYFDGKLANEVPTTSPVDTISDDQWKALVEMWSSAKHKVISVVVCYYSFLVVLPTQLYPLHYFKCFLFHWITL